MDFLTWVGIWFLIMGVCAFFRKMADERLLRDNPEAWKAKQEAEAKEKERKRKATGENISTGLKIADWWWRK